MDIDLTVDISIIIFNVVIISCVEEQKMSRDCARPFVCSSLRQVHYSKFCETISKNLLNIRLIERM